MALFFCEKSDFFSEFGDMTPVTGKSGGGTFLKMLMAFFWYTTCSDSILNEGDLNSV